MRASFRPLPANLPRPRWSVMIPTYNSAVFLQRTLESVLSQDPGARQMQIEVIDDSSSDDPRSIVEALGSGRVAFYSQPAHVGQIANLSACIERSRGEIVHLLHGDDYVLPGFYAALERGFASDPEIGAAFCRWVIVDSDDRTVSEAEPEQDHAGPLENALERLASEQRIVTPSIAVRRSVWECLGGFDSRLRCAEDWEMWVRIAARFPVWYEPAVLAAYRQHAGSTTARSSRNADELRYSKMAIEMFTPLLPPDRARAIAGHARRAYARAALARFASFSRQREWRAAWANLAMAAKLDPSLRMVRAAGRALVQAPER